MNFIDELKWRGLLSDSTPGVVSIFGSDKKIVTAYIGFDPTATSLHVGSLLPIILLKHLQLSGNRPIVLLGGATGMIGDPSGKSAERSLLDDATIQQNQQAIEQQLKRFLDFTSGKPNQAVILNNADWIKQFSFLSFLRDVGKSITINYMLAKDSVKKRIQSQTGISYTEFAYMLIQGYDFLHLFEKYDCALQMGGSDQWGNMTTGIELIRKKNGGEAFVCTCPLVVKADGTKFGKTEGGNIWLDPNLTSPFQFYQFWLNASDADASIWIKYFSFLDESTCASIIKEHQDKPENRLLQKTLAAEVTGFVHGKDALASALQTTEQLFSQKHKSIDDMSIEEIDNIQGIEKMSITHAQLATGIDIATLLVDCKICSSKGDAKKLVQNGGVHLNQVRVSAFNMVVTQKDVFKEKYLFLQKGKKNYYLVEVVSN